MGVSAWVESCVCHLLDELDVLRSESRVGKVPHHDVATAEADLALIISRSA